MKVLIKSATIIDSKSEFNNTIQDILIENNKITKIASQIEAPKNAKVIERENLHVSQGWFDSSVSFGEPGYEDRETLANGLKTAALSGFTTIALQPNVFPIADSSTAIAFILNKAQQSAVKTVPIGALTKKSEGLDMAELFDMKNTGAVAFYDYKHAIENANVLKIALQYASTFNGLVCSYPQDNSIARDGVVNEHHSSLHLGLKGNPNMAEALQVSRDMQLAEYTNGKLHIPTISTAESVQLIREAKQKKIDISCSVAIHNLCFTDAILSGFDTKYKVQPPLRTQTDVDALIQGVKDGTIDMVTCDHCPITIEDKNIEFDYAKYGSIGLETAFGALQTIFTTKKTIDLLTKGKSRFGEEKTPIAVGNTANISLFNPNAKYVFSDAEILSKSKNSIFKNEALKGKAYGIIANNKIELKNE